MALKKESRHRKLLHKSACCFYIRAFRSVRKAALPALAPPRNAQGPCEHAPQGPAPSRASP